MPNSALTIVKFS